jgi:hypothetical protein
MPTIRTKTRRVGPSDVAVIAPSAMKRAVAVTAMATQTVEANSASYGSIASCENGVRLEAEAAARKVITMRGNVATVSRYGRYARRPSCSGILDSWPSQTVRSMTLTLVSRLEGCWLWREPDASAALRTVDQAAQVQSLKRRKDSMPQSVRRRVYASAPPSTGIAACQVLLTATRSRPRVMESLVRLVLKLLHGARASLQN